MTKKKTLSKSQNKLIDGFSTLLEGFKELEEKLADEYDTDSGEELSSAMVSEISTAIDEIVDQDEHSPTFMASVVSTLTEALKELDPEIFEHSEEEEEDEDEDGDDDVEDIDLDDDEYYRDS